MTLPQFLIVGAMKAGTTSLFLDLGTHPAVFLPIDKEPNSLRRDDIFTPVIPDNGFAIDMSMPLVRDVLVDWLRRGPATLRPEDFSSDGAPTWNVPALLPANCGL